MIVLDTDYISLLQRENSAEADTITRGLESSGDPVATTIMTAEEQMRGWLAAIRRVNDLRNQIPAYTSLLRMLDFFADWTILPWNERAVDIFEELRGQKLRIGTMDLKIGSIVLAHDGILLSRNLGDFERIPDLRVEDWLS